MSDTIKDWNGNKDIWEVYHNGIKWEMNIIYEHILYLPLYNWAIDVADS